MKEMQIEKIAYQWNNPHGIWVVLQEKRKQRRLPMIVGQFEGTALLQGLENVKLARPFTHDLLAATLEALGAVVKHIVLTEWKEEHHTFYAAIIVELNGTTHNIDARPSDALALAVRKKAPIFAEEALLGVEPKARPKANAKVAAAPPLVTLWPIASEKPPKRSAKPSKKPGKRG